MGFPCGSAGKESTCNVRGLGSIPGLGRFSREGKGYPLQYSGLENSMDCIIHGVTRSQTQLRDFHLLFLYWTSKVNWKICCHYFNDLSLITAVQFSSVQLLSCVQLFATPGLLSPWNSPGQNTGGGSHSLLQGIFSTQGSSPDLAGGFFTA